MIQLKSDTVEEMTRKIINDVESRRNLQCQTSCATGWGIYLASLMQYVEKDHGTPR
jgi:hypothetical protein